MVVRPASADPLEEIELRQDQVLAELDELDRRVERVLAECIAGPAGNAN